MIYSEKLRRDTAVVGLTVTTLSALDGFFIDHGRTPFDFATGGIALMNLSNFFDRHATNGQKFLSGVGIAAAGTSVGLSQLMAGSNPFAADILSFTSFLIPVATALSAGRRSPRGR